MKHERKPTFYERLQICRNVENTYSNFNITATYSEVVEPNVLSHALRNFLLKNPTFTTNFFREEHSEDDAKENGNNYTVKTVQLIRYTDVVEHRNISGTLDGNLLKSFNEVRFDLNVNTPPWRIIISEAKNKIYYTLAVDHILGDANGSCNFHQDLLNEVAKLLKSKAQLQQLDILLDYSKDAEVLAPLCPTTTDLVDLFTPSLLFTVVAIAKELFLPNFAKKLLDKYIYGYDFDTYPLFTNRGLQVPTKVNYRIINISAEELENLLQFLRSKGTTFTPYFAAVASKTLQEVVFPHFHKNQCSTKLLTVLDGRRYYPDLQNELRYNYVVGFSEVILRPIPSSLGYEAVAESTASIAQRMKEDIDSKVGFKTIGLLSYVNIWDYIRSKIGSLDARVTMEVSNIGNKPIGNEEIEVLDLWFSQDIGVSGHFVYSAVGTPSGGINVVIASLDDVENTVDPNTDVKVMDTFAKKLTTELKHYN